MRNVLVAVAGLSPQVITETLFALWAEQRGVAEVRVITTTVGREKVLGSLLSNDSSAYFRLLGEYNIDKNSISFSPNNIHVPRREAGTELSDILSEEDNELFLQLCLKVTHELTSQPETAVFFSVAGGRKTMTSCLTLAAQLYGRPQDRMFHVLVSPNFERSEQFYFPYKQPRILELIDHSGERFYKSTEFAHINLIHIPFVSVRSRLSPRLLAEPMEPSTLIASLVKENRENLIVDLKARKLRYQGLECDLRPVMMALYAFFAFRRAENLPPISFSEVVEKSGEIAALYQRVGGKIARVEPSDTGILNMSQENFNSYKSKLQRLIRSSFGAHLGEKFYISTEGQRPETRFGIRLDPEFIEIDS